MRRPNGILFRKNPCRTLEILLYYEDIQDDIVSIGAHIEPIYVLMPVTACPTCVVVVC